MIEVLKVFYDGDVLVREFSKDGINVSHVVRDLTPYYKIYLKTDKEEIISDGIDTLKITVEVFNYFNEKQTMWVGDIVIEVDGVIETIPTTNGEASTTFSTTVPKEYTIQTNIPNVQDAQVKVVAE